MIWLSLDYGFKYIGPVKFMHTCKQRLIVMGKRLNKCIGSEGAADI
jgi:hypothetical protein